MEDRNTVIQRHIAARVAERGMTLIEIMIVILIMAMIATGVSIAVTQRLESARESDARIGACTIGNAVTMYMAEHPRKCPTLEDLKDGYLDAAKGTQDPWDQDYVIDCTDKVPDVYSPGPDGQGGTPVRCEKKKSEE
jgi:general secretion pathway protein G